MRLLYVLIAIPVLSAAQSVAPTAFPEGATALASDSLRERLAGKVFSVRPVSDPEIRVQYQGDFAFVNIGNASDAGKWRVEGSSVCNDWRNFRPSCSEVRLLGDVMYIKRANNGEVIAMQPK